MPKQYRVTIQPFEMEKSATAGNFFEECCTFCTREEYKKGYEVFLEKCGQNPRLRENLDRYLRPAMTKVHLQADHCSVLSVGAGEGETDLIVLKILNDVSKKRILYRPIEPNEVSWSKCKKSLEESFQEFSGSDGVMYEMTRPQTFKKYIETNTAGSKTFDVVLFIHSLYYMNVEEALTHCYNNELRDNGLIICVTAANDLSQALITTVFGATLPYEKIIEVAQKYGWNYQENVDEYLVDVTDIQDDQSIPGNLLLNFLTLTVDFRATADTKMVDNVLDVINTSSFHKEGKVYCEKNDHYIFIFK